MKFEKSRSRSKFTVTRENNDPEVVGATSSILMIRLRCRLLSEARAALKSGELQWALELSSHVYRVDREAALTVRLEALRALAAQQSNPSARNFYLTAALDDHRLIDWTTDFSQVSPVRTYFKPFQPT